MTPAERVKFIPVLEKKGLSTRTSCGLLEIARSRLAYKPRVNPEREMLRQVIREEALGHPVYGYRRIHYRLTKKRKIPVTISRVYRIWRAEGLALKPIRKKRGRKYGQGLQSPPKALYPNHVWTYDFLKLRLYNGNYVRILALLDEFTRECLGFYMARSIPSSKVLEFLQGVIATRGVVPEFLRSDNGPEFIEKSLNAWLKEQGTRPVFITPGSPWENGKCESFNGKFRTEFLNRNIHYSLKVLQIQAGWWRKHYNQERPHSALGYQTPEEFAQAWYDKHQDTKETKRIETEKPRPEPNALPTVAIQSTPLKPVDGLSTLEDPKSPNHTLQINLV